jgi:hypothetical protein
MLKTALSSLFLLLTGCDRAPKPMPPKASLELPRADGSDAVPKQIEAKAPAAHPGRTLYVCPMHPEIVSEAPGVCPKCNMKLEPKPAAHEHHEETR